MRFILYALLLIPSILTPILAQSGNRYAVKKGYEIPNTTLLVILDNTIKREGKCL